MLYKAKPTFPNETHKLQHESCSRHTPDFKSARHCPIHRQKAPTSLRPFCFDFVKINDTTATHSPDLSSYIVYFVKEREQVPENEPSTRSTIISFQLVRIVSGGVRGFVIVRRYLVEIRSINYYLNKTNHCNMFAR